MSTFNIDFIEFSFLVEACIPPRPIARSMFWDDVINIHYNAMDNEERIRLYDWIGRNEGYKEGLSRKNEQVLIFEARFNPDNQYIVTTELNANATKHLAFKMSDKYYTKTNTWIEESYITNIEKVKT
jgi:hypothetical protein